MNILVTKWVPVSIWDKNNPQLSAAAVASDRGWYQVIGKIVLLGLVKAYFKQIEVLVFMNKAVYATIACFPPFTLFLILCCTWKI